MSVAVVHLHGWDYFWFVVYSVGVFGLGAALQRAVSR